MARAVWEATGPRWRVALLVWWVLLALPSLAAAQLLSHTWVSRSGADFNPCTRSSPCRTFRAAMLKTQEGGEVGVLDGGDYRDNASALVINQGITINGGSATGEVTRVALGISIHASNSAHVVIKNITIQGAGSCTSGVDITYAANVTLRNVVIENCSSSGVVVEPPSSGAVRVVIENSTIWNCGTGVKLAGTGVSGFLLNSTIDLSSTASVTVGGSARLVVSGSALLGSATAIHAPGGTVTSYGNNTVRGAGLFTQTLGLQ